MKRLFMVCLLVAASASAQVARVFLAGTGSDAGDCSNQARLCRGLQGAVTQCPVNGEIIVLDNGGYGSASITKSLAVNRSTGVVATTRTGIEAQVFGGGIATVRATNSTIDHNADGMLVSGAGAAIESYGNNRVTANTNNSTFSGTVLLLQ